MSEHAELLKRLRRLAIIDEVGSNNPLANEAADIIETQAKHITELESTLLRIGQPGKEIIFCRDGHEESVLLARSVFSGDNN